MHFQRPHAGAFREAGALAEDFDGAFLRLVKADDGAQQHRLAGAGAAHHAQNLAAINIEIQMIVHDLGAEACHQALDMNDDILVAFFRHHTPRTENMMEKAASSTMTRNTDSTTERVVRSPTLAALRSTWKPS